MAERYEYAGSELELFSSARLWKGYVRSHLRPHIRGDVLEVGAGLGATSQMLCSGVQTTWTCLEPDLSLYRQLLRLLEEAPEQWPLQPRVVQGTIRDLLESPDYDTILYIDVLEHIEGDDDELAEAAKRLREGGKLIVLSPAYPLLFSPFDAAIGHYRRYTRKTLSALTPPGVELVFTRYIDSVGLLASLGNRFLLRSSTPGPLQIRVWDGVFVPCSRITDPLLRYRLGKTIIAAWEKSSPPRRSGRS